ncbi:MAG: response regulator [Deltaproteobacteria bacterium]|nr:response regulator [Deltaproteobacteria bacterium]MBZ0219556.1 response regulator [Deltaproteobacteria bacterium]
MKALVVDDEETMLEVCSEILESAGFEVKRAPSGEAALGLIGEGRGEDCDLVLTDMDMPGLHGMDFFRRAVSLNGGLRQRFLFMTGGDRKGLEAASAANANFIVKPFRVKDFLASVERVITNTRVSGRTDARQTMHGRALSVSAQGFNMNAFSEDISRRGMRIRYSGKMLEPGSTMELALTGFCLNLVKQAEVVWSRKKGNGGFSSGLLFTMPLPDSAIVELVLEGQYSYEGGLR